MNDPIHIHVQNRAVNDFVSITPAMMETLSTAHPHVVTLSDHADGFAAARAGMEILVTTADQIRMHFPCDAPRLRAVFLLHAGLNGLDRDNPLPDGVMVLNNSGAHSRKAGEYVVMAALMLVNQIASYAAQQQREVWKPFLTSTLGGRRVTILGVGGLGSGAARALRPFGVHLTGLRNRDEPHADFDATGPISDLDAVLPRTDLLVIAAPLTTATHGLVGARQLALLPAHAGLINIARGELLDQPALIGALKGRRLAGAVLDVQAVEPVPQGDPLWTTPNLVLTPHISATDSENFGRDTIAVLERNLDALVAGRRPPNRMDLRRGY